MKRMITNSKLVMTAITKDVVQKQKMWFRKCIDVYCRTTIKTHCTCNQMLQLIYETLMRDTKLLKIYGDLAMHV